MPIQVISSSDEERLRRLRNIGIIAHIDAPVDHFIFNGADGSAAREKQNEDQ